MSGLDIVTNDAGDQVRRAHARDLGENVIVALHRLARLTRLHDLENQAFSRQLDQTHKMVVDYCLHAGTNLNVLFADRVVLIGGQLLKGSRAAYESATDLGEILAACGGAELTIARDVTSKDLKAFADALSTAFRSRKGQAFVSPSAKIRLRSVSDAARRRGIDLDHLPFEKRVVRTYASAVVIMRRFFDDLRAGRYTLPRRLKRVAQSLVDLSAGNTPSYLGVTEVRNQNHDDAGRAVNTAILAVAIARQLGADRVLLAQLAMAAMLHDVARPRALGLPGKGSGQLSNFAPRMTEDAEDRLPAGTAAVLTALGRVNDPSIRRTVLTFEALWLRRAANLGPLYRGTREPTIHARIIAAARRYNDLVTPEPGLTPPLPEAAIATMARDARSSQDQTILRVLVSTLGVFPVGTLVKLSTGQTAEVIPGRSEKAKLAQPRLRIVLDAQGNVLAKQQEIDLAAPPKSATSVRIALVLNTDGWARVHFVSEDPSPLDRDDDDPIPLPPPLPRSQRPAPRTTEVPPAPRATFPTSPPARQRTTPPPNDNALDLPVLGAPPSLPPRARPSVPPATEITPPPVSLKAATAALQASLNANLSQDNRAAERISSIPKPPTPFRIPTPPPIATVPPRPLPPKNEPHIDEERTLFESSPDFAIDPPPQEEPEEEEAGTLFLQREAVAATIEKISYSQHAAALPTAQGILSKTPLVHVLVYVLDRALTGSLVLRDPEQREHCVYFDRGAPAKLRTNHPIAQLGEQLIAARQIAPGIVDTMVGLARHEHTPFGKFLVSRGLASKDAVEAALRSQIVRRLEWLAKLPGDTHYEFCSDEDLLAAVSPQEPTPCEPLSAILCAMRAWNDHPRIMTNLMRLKEHPVVLHPNADLTPLTLTPEESRLVDRIRTQRLTLLELYDNSLATDHGTSALLYTLLATRQLVVPGQNREPMRSPLHATVAAPRISKPPAPARPSTAQTPPPRPLAPVSDDYDRDSRSSYPSLDTSPSAVAQVMAADFKLPAAAKPPAATRDNAHPARRSTPEGAFAPPTLRPLQAPGTDAERQATARGNLAATPLIHVLVYMLDHAASGTIVLREPDKTEHSLLFQNGAPTKVRTGRPIALLGELLVAKGQLDASKLEDAADTASAIDALIGEYLVLENLTTRDAVAGALEQQVVEKTLGLVNIPAETTYAYFRNADTVSSWRGKEQFRANPLSVILAASRVWQDRRRMLVALQKIRDQRLLIHPDSDLSGLARTARETTVLNTIKAGDATLRSLVDRNLAPEEEVHALIYALAITRQFGYRGQAKKPPMIASPPADSGSPSMEPPPPSLERLRPSSYHGYGAPSRDSGPSSWTGARITSIPYPPENLTTTETPRPVGADPIRRIRPPADTEEAVEQALMADDAYRSALESMRKGDTAAATEAATRACATDPENPDYAALCAWLDAEADGPDSVTQGVDALTFTLRKFPNCQNALLYRAKLHRKSNNLENALRDFERLLELNPAHREAGAEARILRQRARR